GARAFGYATLFGVGLALRLRSDSATVVSVTLITYLVAWLGLRRSLKYWPSWEYWQDAVNIQGQSVELSFNARRLGWPFDRLAPRFTYGEEGLRPIDGLMVGLMGGWWMYAAGSLIPEVSIPLSWMVLVNTTMATSIGRLVVYLTGFAPPISLWGRLRTLRLVQPSYDQVFVTPFVAIIVGTAGPHGLYRLGLPLE